MNQTIGGTLTFAALQRLHQPFETEKIDAEIRRLHRDGLQPRDVSEALRLPLDKVVNVLMKFDQPLRT